MKKTLQLFSAIIVIALAASCSQKEGLKSPPKHVIMIGFDGLSSYSLNNGADMPTFRRLMKEGSYTLENRSVLPSSSAVNWASMFMGAGPELHGYTTWGSRTPDLPSRVLTENGIFPDIYGELRKGCPQAEQGIIYEWAGIRYLVDTLSINYIERVPSLSVENISESVGSAVNYIKTKKPMFLSIVFDQPDGAGHKYGWESPEYFEKINQLDKSLEAILNAVEEAGIMDETIIILTSDHGGIEKGHGGKTMKEMEVPIVFYGKGIKKGYVIPESVMMFDFAPTVAYMFGVDQPQVWIGRPIKSIFNEN